MGKNNTNYIISKEVQEFYNKTPFPGFDLYKYNNSLDLYKNANLFAKKLDYQIPYNVSIVDVGCGTGQLACLLSLKDRKVLGIDFSAASLEKAKELAAKLCLGNITFERGDVLNLSRPPKFFDYIFCCGVLHHTADAYKGLENVIKFGKSGSYIVLGLYNKYGRLFLKTKQFLHRKFRNLYSKNMHKAAIELHGKNEPDQEKDYSWFLDQYEHPHETTHTVGEVLNWFKKNKIDYVNSIPSVSFFGKDNNFSGIFKNKGKIAPPKLLLRFLTQLKWIISLRKTGGYFIIVGKIQ